MSEPVTRIQDETDSTPISILSLHPIILSAPERGQDLTLRVSAPVTGRNLPVILFAHGFGSSADGYAPLVNYWVARGFVVIQPTFLDSRTLSADPKASHSEAVKAYLEDPRKKSMWRYRVNDMKQCLDQLNLIEEAFPNIKGRLDPTCIAAVGHSFGAQTVGMLLGARILEADGQLGEDLFDARIKAGVLLSAGGRGGTDLSPFGTAHFPHLNQSYAHLTTPTLVVAGDQDHSPLTLRGPDWFTDAYSLSPGANGLVSLFGGEHMLGGISGYYVTETTDENPQRVRAVQQLTWSYLRSTLYADDAAWPSAVTHLMKALDHWVGWKPNRAFDLRSAGCTKELTSDV